MNAKDTYSVAIIGAGRIGCGFDTPDAAHILTHAHAIQKNSHLVLSGIVDTNVDTGTREATKWGVPFFANIDALYASLSSDIVVIATPDHTHATLLQQIVARKPRLVVCEKPIGVGPEDVANITALDTSVPVIVNFSRRFDTVALELAAELARGTYGAVISAHATYVRGVRHNGSHLFDLARLFFGEMTDAAAHGSVEDFTPEDPTIGGFAAFERCPRFYIAPGDGRSASIFELDILTEKKRIRFVDEGAQVIVQEVIDDPLYAGFRILGPEDRRPTLLSQSLPNLYAHAIEVLQGAGTVRSSLESAKKTHEACERFADSLK